MTISWHLCDDIDLSYAVGRVIAKAVIDPADDDTIKLHFSQGDVMWLKDWPDCCESRYFRTDDNLDDYIGAKVLGISIDDAPNLESEHEIQFLVIRTDKGAITFAAHNEHNGYYGGFCVECVRYYE